MDRTQSAKFSSRSVKLFWGRLNSCVYAYRKPDPVQPWLCLALSLMLHTQGQTAGPTMEISSPLENKGWNAIDFWFNQKCHNNIVTLFLSRFCQNNGPSNYRSRASKLILEFRSNKRVHGRGAECTIACSDFTPTAETNPPCIPQGTVLNSQSWPNVIRSQ